MSEHVTDADIQKIIQSVLQNIDTVLKPETVHKAELEVAKITPIKMKKTTYSSSSLEQKSSSLSVNPPYEGVFETIEEAIDAAAKAQKEYMANYQLRDRERIITSIRTAVIQQVEVLAKMVYEETGIGRYEDKIAKHELVASHTPGTEDLDTKAVSGDNGLTIVEQAPFGLVGVVTPVTNPTETIINNTIGLLAAGNSLVLNVHPASKQSCAYVVDLLNKAIMQSGGPANLVTMVNNPSLKTLQGIMDSEKVRLLVGTGGPALVKTLLRSGKKAIGAGAGNPPVIVDDTADVENAAKSIITGASFDNNLLCIAEKEVFVLDSVANDLIFHMLNNGAYMLDQHQLAQLMSFALEENVQQESRGCSLDQKRDYHIAKQWVGKDASLFLQQLGVVAPADVKLLICEVNVDHPFVQLEQMMPVLPIVRVNTLEEAIELAVQAEHSNRHTAIMHSRNVDHLTKFARAIETTIFVKNASSLAGVGFGGEGHTTMTIAGPTGEGITSARTFTRQRRCVLAEGGFRIIG